MELTEREKQILGLVCIGLTNKEISERLMISVTTVKFHISNIYFKLNLKNRAQLVTYAIKNNLTTIICA